jgi:hypothetical protein
MNDVCFCVTRLSKIVISILYLVNIYFSYTEHNGQNLKWERVGDSQMFVSDFVFLIFILS